MNNLVSPYLVACMILGSVSPLAAKDHGSPRMLKNQTAAIAAVTSKAPAPRQPMGVVSDKPAILISSEQPVSPPDAKTARSIHRADGFDVLGKPRTQRRMVAADGERKTYTVSACSYQTGLTLVASLYQKSALDR